MLESDSTTQDEVLEERRFEPSAFAHPRLSPQSADSASCSMSSMRCLGRGFIVWSSPGRQPTVRGRSRRRRANSNGLTVFLRSGLPGRRISPEKGHPGSWPWAGGPGLTPAARWALDPKIVGPCAASKIPQIFAPPAFADGAVEIYRSSLALSFLIASPCMAESQPQHDTTTPQGPFPFVSFTY